MRYAESFDILRAVDTDGTEHHAKGIKIKDGYTKVACEKLYQLEDVLEKYNLDTPEQLDKCLDCHNEYKQIEEELNIDLITFYKIYVYGFYYKYKDEILYGIGYDNEINVASHKITTRYTTLHFKDYGRTWALTKEELE